MPINYTKKKNRKECFKSGVHKNEKSNKWFAQIYYCGKLIKSNLYDTVNKAKIEFLKMKNEYNKSKPSITKNKSNEDECSSCSENEIDSETETDLSYSKKLNTKHNFDVIDKYDENDTEIEDNMSTGTWADDEELIVDNFRRYSKRNRKKNVIFTPQIESDYNYKSRIKTNKKCIRKNTPKKVVNKIIGKNNIKKVANKGISKDLKIRIIPLQLDKDKKLLAQNNKCNICNHNLGIDREYDHIIPKFLGGKDKYINMQFLCKSCHKWKSNYLDRNIIKPIISNDKTNNFKKIIKDIILLEKKEFIDYYQEY